MISVFQTNVLNPVQLYFGGSSSTREVCMAADPDEFIWAYRPSWASALDGTYYVDGQSLADANYVYHDSLGQNRFYAPGVGAPRIADNFGNYAKIDNAHNITPPSSLSSKGTWVGVEENNNTQIIWIAAADNVPGTARGYGSMYYSNPTLIDLTTTNTASITKYRTGMFYKGYTSKNNYAVDMGVVGNIKSGIGTNDSVGFPSGYHLLTTSNAKVRTNFDLYGTNGLSNYSSITRYNTELMYLTPAQMTAGDASVATTQYYIQYDTSGNYQKPNGAFASWLHPRHGPAICNNTGLNGTYHHGFWHSYSQMNGALLGTFTSRLLIKSSTPSVTGGGDNGNGDIGWYKQTGSSTVWTYFNGNKWTIDQTL